MNGLGMTEGVTINTWIGSQTLLVPWENPLPSTIRLQVQVLKKSLELTKLLRILDRGGDHMGKDGKVIIWVPTKKRL